MEHSLSTVDDVRRSPIRLWNGLEAWVWGLTFGQFLALQREAQFPGADGEPRFDAERYAIARVIECVRRSGEPGAEPLFTRAEHTEWLRARSAQSIERILRLSMELSGELEGPGCSDPPASPSGSGGSA